MGATLDLRPAILNLELWQNDTWTTPITIKAAGAAVDLTGASVRMMVKGPNGNLIHTYTSAAGNFTIDGPNGKITPIITPTAVERGIHDIQVTFSGGIKRTFARGLWVVSAEVTTG